MWLIIGVSGATCSGKSSLAHSLEKALPGSKLVCQDDFFLPEDSERHTWIPSLKHINWEIMSSLDMEKMHKTVNDIISCRSPSNITLHALDKIATSNIGVESEKTGNYEERSKIATKNKTPQMNGEYSASTSDVNTENTETSGINILIIEGFLIFNDKKLADLCHMKYFLTLDKEECWARRSVRTYNPPDVPGFFDLCVWPEYVKHRDQVFEEVCDVNIIDGTKTRSDILNQVLLDIIKRAREMIDKCDG